MPPEPKKAITMEWVETTGRTIAEALDAALDELGVDEEDVEYEVLEEPKSGFLGRIGSSEGRIRARVKPISREKPGERQRRKGRGSSRPRSDSPRGGNGGGGNGSGGNDAGGNGSAAADRPQRETAGTGSSNRRRRGGRGGGGARGGGPPGGRAENTDREDLTTPTDFWGKYTFAKK